MKHRAWNSTLPAPSKPIKRSGYLDRTAPLRDSGKGRKCYEHLRDPKFREFVKEKGCIGRRWRWHCCAGRVEFAHLNNEGNGYPDRGNGVGMCTSLHTGAGASWHNLGKDSFQRHWKVDAFQLAADLEAEYQEIEGKGFA